MHQQQQLLSNIQEQILLKWIKELTISRYTPSHRILQEVADEIYINRCCIFQLSTLSTLSTLYTLYTQYTQQEYIPDFPLGQEWALCFIKQHPHLQV